MGRFPPTAVSGIYFAKLMRDNNTGRLSHIVFVVRDDARPSRPGGADI